MEIFIIAAFDEGYGLGFDGHLLYHLKGDMSRFFQKTRDAVLIMGRRTFESLPAGGLKGRHHVVLSSLPTERIAFPSLFGERYTVVPSMETALIEAESAARKNGLGKIAICGGSDVYRQAIPYCDAAYITHIHSVRSADTFFPAYEFYKAFSSTPERVRALEESGVHYTFYNYSNRHKQHGTQKAQVA